MSESRREVVREERKREREQYMCNPLTYSSHNASVNLNQLTKDTHTHTHTLIEGLNSVHIQYIVYTSTHTVM